MKNFNNFTDDELIDFLLNELPHGSGVNGDWSLIFTDNQLQCFNTYDAMDEWGGYCHCYDFYAAFQRDDLSLLFVQFDCEVDPSTICACGDGLGDYLDDLFAEWTYSIFRMIKKG